MDNTATIIVIITSIIITAFTTISTIHNLQIDFRKHIDRVLEDKEINIKTWIKQTLVDYHLPIDSQLKEIHYRLKTLEDDLYK